MVSPRVSSNDAVLASKDDILRNFNLKKLTLFVNVLYYSSDSTKRKFNVLATKPH